jgi:MerR family mercuric resistance operon transcriptional regulator
MSETGLRGGEVADAAGVNVQTLRYYQRRVLLHGQDHQAWTSQHRFGK